MWMSGKPADPGFYWHREGPDDDEPTVIELDMAGYVHFLGGEPLDPGEALKGQYFAGSIQPPAN